MSFNFFTRYIPRLTFPHSIPYTRPSRSILTFNSSIRYTRSLNLNPSKSRYPFRTTQCASTFVRILIPDSLELELRTSRVCIFIEWPLRIDRIISTMIILAIVARCQLSSLLPPLLSRGFSRELKIGNRRRLGAFSIIRGFAFLVPSFWFLERSQILYINALLVVHLRFRFRLNSFLTYDY